MEFDGNWLHARALFFSFLTTPSGQLQINSRIVWFMPRTCFSFLRGMTYISCLLCPAKRAVVQRNVSECQLYTSPVNVVLYRCFLSLLASEFSYYPRRTLNHITKSVSTGKAQGGSQVWGHFRLSSASNWAVAWGFRKRSRCASPDLDEDSGWLGSCSQ